MTTNRSVQRLTAQFERRQPAITNPRGTVAVAPSPARALQERLGNHGAQQFASQMVSRSIARASPSPVLTPSTPHLTPEVAAGIGALRGGGSPLPSSTRDFFEARFGADFSRVRVHSDTRAADVARSIDANAFTVGRDIAFGAGQYAPQSDGGKRLLAHELTHVVQQDGLQMPSVSVGVVHQSLVQRDRRKAKPDAKKRTPSFDRAAIEAIKSRAEKRHESITQFIRESRGVLQNYKSRLLSAAALYKTAFNRHKKVLAKAKQSAADRKEMITTIAGFGVGVALGVPGVVARMGLAKLAASSTRAFAVGGELAELFVDRTVGWAVDVPDAKAFEPTAEIPELKELTVWRNLAEMSDKLLVIALLTAKQLKIVSAGGTAITEIRLREGGAKNLEKTDAELQELVEALKHADELSGEVASGLKDAKAEIEALAASARPRSMTEEEVEQDIWIEWIADLTNDDLLDEDDITDHLEALNVIGGGRVFWDEDDGWSREAPRLSVDFGSWVSDEDERDAVAAARAKLGRAPVEKSYYYEED